MLEANAALPTILRRNIGEGYEEFLKRLAQELGMPTPDAHITTLKDSRESGTADCNA
jgi:hypothetical protein